MKESTNHPDFLLRTAVATLMTGVLAGLVVAWVWGWKTASGFELAVFWGLANFSVLAVILRNVTNPAGARLGPLLGWVALKLVGLYGLAILILVNRWFPLGAFVVGLSWPLLIAVLRGLAPARRIPRLGPSEVSRSGRAS